MKSISSFGHNGSKPFIIAATVTMKFVEILLQDGWASANLRV
jgi:hypothetical protein